MTKHKQTRASSEEPRQRETVGGTAQTGHHEGLRVVQEELETEVVTLVDAGLDTALTDHGCAQLQGRSDEGVHVVLEEVWVWVEVPDPMQSRVATELPRMERALHRLVWEALESV